MWGILQRAKQQFSYVIFLDILLLKTTGFSLLIIYCLIHLRTRSSLICFVMVLYLRTCLLLMCT